MAATVAYGSLPFAEQIEFFRRKVNLPTKAWTDIWQSEHDHAFVVAGANRDDLVADFRAAIDKAIANGATLEEFRKDFDAIVAKHGWSYNGGRNWRSRVIYETNMRTSYAAGRYAQLQAIKHRRPYWQYEHSDAVEHPRLMHLAWNGLVLDADDPWWNTHYPPNGWGCQCTVRSLAKRDLRRMGKEGPDNPPPDVPPQNTVGQQGQTPRTVVTPGGVDPGFGYAPGQDAWARQWANRAEDMRAAQDPQRWEPVLTTTAQDLGLPRQLPVAPMPANITLAAPAQNVDGLVETLRAVIGGAEKAYDVKGVPVLVHAEFLGNHLEKDLARSIYLPLLPDLLENPQEVWWHLERQAETGAMRTSFLVIKTYQIGRDRSLRFVARIHNQTLLSWTFVPMRAGGANAARRGLLWWQAGAGE